MHSEGAHALPRLGLRNLSIVRHSSYGLRTTTRSDAPDVLLSISESNCKEVPVKSITGSVFEGLLQQVARDIPYCWRTDLLQHAGAVLPAGRTKLPALARPCPTT